LIAIALAYARRKRYAQALGAFRRAIEVDRDRIERNPLAVRALAQSFLHRAEQLEREDRVAIARSLIEEVLTLDLRRAPSSLRFALEQRREVLRGRGVG
jgi:tetratricopeptide (TPR) repeat protein